VSQALQRFRLCGVCLDRQGVKVPQLELTSPKECFICRGLTAELEPVTRVLAKKIHGHEFHDFSVGLTLPEGVQEREDELRAEWKIKGRETIKAQMSRNIANALSKRSRRNVNKLRPELLILVDLSSNDTKFLSRPLFVYGKYTKPSGLPQHTRRCSACGGRGCQTCNFTGLDSAPSVESILQKKLGRILGSENVRISWLGSEDAESRVYPPGRPFVAEAKSPTKRKVPRGFGARTGSGRLEVTGLKLLAGKPSRLPSFKFRTLAFVDSTTKFMPDDLKSLSKEFRNTTVEFRRPGESPVLRTVYRVKARLVRGALQADIELDGGLPVKRLVSGESVSPSFTEVLKTEVRCRKFDIYRVSETSEFEFA
jgi:tRNA pseudouridine synthase 10